MSTDAAHAHTAPADRSRSLLVTARAGFGAVVLAAGVSGLALLLFPDSTGRFFSWGLGPPALATLIGGLYLASAVTFGVALRLTWKGIESLLAASVVLTAPTLVFTLVHLDVFDFGRWQAWAWLALFVAAPPFWGGLLWMGRRVEPGPRPTTGGLPAFALWALAVVLAVPGVAMWIEPELGSRFLALEVAGLGGRFIGAWLAFLAVMAAWCALRPGERLLPSMALAAYPAGALAAGLRSFPELTSGTRLLYLGGLALLAVIFVAAAIGASRESAVGPGTGRE